MFFIFAAYSLQHIIEIESMQKQDISHHTVSIFHSWASVFSLLTSIIVMGLSAISCQTQTERTLDNAKDTTKYAGPIAEFKNIETFYSQQAMVRLRLTAPVQWRFTNGNLEFPEGLHMEVFDELGKKDTDLVADYGLNETQKAKYTVTGNVVVENMEEHQTLETPRLYWDRKKREIYSDTTVIVTTPTAKLYGIGLIADEGFSRYRILEPTGPITVDE